MIAFENGLYVRVEEFQGPRAPMPRPLANGFSKDRAYRAIGLYSPSESADAYFVLSNDRDEVWFICNRHLRVVGLRAVGALHIPLAEFASPHASPSLHEAPGVSERPH